MRCFKTAIKCFTMFVVAVLPAFGFAEHAAYTDAESAGPDFLIQGEYTGTVGGEHPIAAQVIALGDGQFEGVLFSGGLPGAGWDGKTRYYFKGHRNGDTATFVGIHGERLMFDNPNFTGTIVADTFRGEAQMFRNVAQHAEFELDKTHRESPTLGAKPPEGAIVLFDGSSTDAWTNARLVDGSLLDVGTTTKQKFNDVRLHLEFCCPFMPTAAGMARGNSGIYFKEEFEVQAIDSFGWTCSNRKFERLSDFARCGGIHEMVQPQLNMCLPPLSWQTYDIEFADARFDTSGRKTAPAMLTVRLNGVLVQDHYVLPPVPPGHDSESTKEGKPGPIHLQNHGNPVRFRNIWAFTPN